MAANGKNYGSVWQSNAYGTTSPASPSAPTDPLDGQPMDGLTAITPVVSSASGTTLSGAGTLQAYILDAGIDPPTATGSAATSDATTIILNESGITDGFVVGMNVHGVKSGATGTITSIGGGGNVVLTCSGGVTGTVIANESIIGVDPGRWMRFPDADYTVVSTTRDQPFLAFSLLTPRKGRIIWLPNGVTFSGGSAGIIITQLGQSATALHNAGWWS